MGGQMHQSNAAAAALYDNAGAAVHSAAPGTATDAGDAVMARWLQSAGLQHLASPLASTAIDQRLLPNLLMQVFQPSLPFIITTRFSSNFQFFT
jgi:kinesin family protein 2/24